jgi:transcription elongation factor GreA
MEPTASLTLEAYRRIKAELEELTTTGRERITEKIKIAREHGDLKENAEYHAAKEEQGMMESKIRKLQHMLRDPEIVEAPEHAEQVVPGMLVTIRPLDEDDPDDETYLLAEHAEEKAPGSRTVTTSSPLGTALLGASPHQEVAYQAPAGTVRYVVVGFEPFAG